MHTHINMQRHIQNKVAQKVVNITRLNGASSAVGMCLSLVDTLQEMAL